MEILHENNSLTSYYQCGTTDLSSYSTSLVEKLNIYLYVPLMKIDSCEKSPLKLLFLPTFKLLNYKPPLEKKKKKNFQNRNTHSSHSDTAILYFQFSIGT